jgi:hypothetical protein
MVACIPFDEHLKPSIGTTSEILNQELTTRDTETHLFSEMHYTEL